MLNILYFYLTGRPTDLNKVSEQEFIGFGSPYQKGIDLHSYSFIYRIRYKSMSKFVALKTLVLDALFMNDHEKHYHLNRFAIAQRCYCVFGRLARICKLKRAKRFDIDCDLCTTPFSALPQSILTNVYDEYSQTIYRFRLSDLMSLANRSLTHAPDFFAEPLALKNPYTNLPFTEAQLYSIYFALKASPLVMSPMFHLWFISNFNLKIFLRRNENLIVDSAIYDFMKYGTGEEWLEQIYEMVNRNTSDFQVADDFPEDILLKALYPFLQNYMFASYSLSPTLRTQAETHLRRQITQFCVQNPLFGRKIYVGQTVKFIGAS